MKFSLYSEMQSWGGRPWRQMYDEVMEQVVNADRLGYDAYGLVEHFCFPEFSISPDPLAFFAACGQLTKADRLPHAPSRSSLPQSCCPGLADRRRGSPARWPL
jgi:hypothetical protein